MTIQLPTTDEQYYLIVNYEMLYTRAVELGYENVILFTGTRFRNRDLASFRAIGKSVYLLFFCPEGHELLDQLGQQFEDHNINWETNNLCGMPAGKWPWNVKTLKQATKYFPEPKKTRQFLERHRIIKSTDYHNRCGNCHAFLKEKARYCVYCGTVRGGGSFKPYENIVHILYGPPNRMKLHCVNCGKQWKSLEWLKHPGYCPRCGKATVVVDDEYTDWDYLK